MRIAQSSLVRGTLGVASRVGHDAVWLAIAALFCVVEGAIKITELVPRSPSATPSRSYGAMRHSLTR